MSSFYTFIHVVTCNARCDFGILIVRALCCIIIIMPKVVYYLYFRCCLMSKVALDVRKVGPQFIKYVYYQEQK